jgi:X-X-X-Leu-X-X-Gly heptad repeat protein
VTLTRKEKTWVVQERGGYPASFQEISDLMIKLVELKVTQSEQVGASLWPRVELADPGKGAGAGTGKDGAGTVKDGAGTVKDGASTVKEGAGTLIEFKDVAGKTLARLVLGKKVLKKDPLNPLPAAKDGVPAGRYVRVDGAGDVVIVVSDPLEKAIADPGRWLTKEFIKLDRVKILTVGPEGGAVNWKITRDEEWGQWKFATGGGMLHPTAAVMAVNKLGQLSFSDIVVDPKSEATEKPLVAVAETFDNLVYTLRLAKKAKGDDYIVTFTLKGEPPKTRVPEKGEKPQDKERNDKSFAEALQRLQARVALEKTLSQWAYVIGKGDLEPLLRSRADMVVQGREGPGR